MHCVNCGTSIPDSASFCPGCGQQTSLSAATSSAADPHPNPEPAKKKSNKALGCVAIAVAVLFVFYLIGRSADTGETNSAAQTSSAAGGGGAETSDKTADTDPTKLPLAVTATELFNAYEANEASAQGYFGGRPLLVSGTVEKVTLDFSDDPVVQLRTPNQFMSAHAMLADDAQSQAGSFSPGDKVKLLFEDVSEVVATPMLKECRTAPAGQKSQAIEWSK